MTGPGRRSGLEFLGTLAGGLVHEIKNPLSTLRINLTLLKEDLAAALPGERSLLRRVEVIEKEVQRLDGVLVDFLRYAGLRRLDRRKQDLRDLTRDLVEFVGPGFQRDGVQLDAEVPELVAEVDGPLLKQALLNLLLNAQQAVRPGGRVRVLGTRDGDRARLEVVDDGCGIAAADLGRVFDVYYSGSKAGSGLGLPTARRIAEEHGGSLELESHEGKGTRVVLTVPLA